MGAVEVKVFTSQTHTYKLCRERYLTKGFAADENLGDKRWVFVRQNGPYFCVFKYARAVKPKVWNEAENRERDV